MIGLNVRHRMGRLGKVLAIVASLCLVMALTAGPAGADPTAPGVPSIGTATAGNRSATVTFTPPSNDGGSPIKSYKVVSNPGGKTENGKTSPITVNGLSNGTSYTFTVTARNAVGLGAPSAASNAVTPFVFRITTTSLPAGTEGVNYPATTLAVKGGVSPFTWSLQSGSSLPAGLSLSTGGTISGKPTGASDTSFTVVVTDSSQPPLSASKRLSISVKGFAVLTSTLPNGVLGDSYSHRLEAVLGDTPYRWSVQSGALPPGLSLSTSGKLSGTPNAAGEYRFTVRVADDSTPPKVATKILTLEIESMSVATDVLPRAAVGDSYSEKLEVSGGDSPFTWSVLSGNLPDGMALSSSGTLSGTPDEDGNFRFRVRVSDDSTPAQTATKDLTLSVDPFEVATTSLPEAEQNESYSEQLEATGGNTPLTWSGVSGSLPNGMSLSSKGKLSGTPTVTGTFRFTVRVTDDDGRTADESLSLKVNA